MVFSTTLMLKFYLCKKDRSILKGEDELVDKLDPVTKVSGKEVYFVLLIVEKIYGDTSTTLLLHSIMLKIWHFNIWLYSRCLICSILRWLFVEVSFIEFVNSLKQPSSLTFTVYIITEVYSELGPRVVTVVLGINKDREV